MANVQMRKQETAIGFTPISPVPVIASPTRTGDYDKYAKISNILLAIGRLPNKRRVDRPIAKHWPIIYGKDIQR